MPTYLYLCEKNETEFEEYHSIMTQLEECPICKEKQLEQHKPKRLIAGGSGKGIVNVTGHELTQKIKEDTQRLKKEVYSNANQYANVLGDAKYQKIQTQLDRRGK